jgi:hypothetical protein
MAKWYETLDELRREAFVPDISEGHTERPDKGLETSINWEDDPSAIDRLDQKNFGVARVPTDQLRELVEQRLLLDLERRERSGNPFHGNIVFHGSRAREKLVASTIALHAKIVDGTVSEEALAKIKERLVREKPGT